MDSEPPPPNVDSNERNLVMLCHLLNIIGFIGPLIIWLVKKDELAAVDREGKEALNWGISVAIVWVALVILSFVSFGITGLLVPVLYLINLIFAIIGALQASKTGSYQYPFSLRLLK